MKRFLFRTSLLAALFLLAGALIYTRVIPECYTPSLIFLLIFIFLVTNIVYGWLFTTLKKNNRKFTNAYLASSFIKMLVYLIVVIAWAWLEREHAKIILVNFLIIYVAFSILEVVEMIRLVKKKK